MAEDPDYDEIVRKQKDAAAAEMGAFLRSLTPAQKLKLDGGRKPQSEKPKQVGLDGDIADSPAASFEIDIAEEVDNLEDELLEEFRFLRRADAAPLAGWITAKVAAESDQYNATLLKRVTSRLIEAGNTKMVAVSMAFALSISRVWVNGVLCKTQMEACEHLVCTRQNMCKEVGKSAAWLGIKDGVHRKKPSAAEACRKAQKANHWRRRKWTGR